MLRKIQIHDLVPSRFQVRQQMNPETIKELASEIDEVGLWAGALRGREVDGGKVELCFGHRRLEAIKKLKWKEVEIEVLPLTDEQMIAQGLIENLQREGLTDVERGDGILLLKQELEKSSGNGISLDKLSRMLGLPRSTIYNYLQIAELKGRDRKAVESGKISGSAALEAKASFGPEMIAIAAENKLTTSQVRELAKAVGESASRKGKQKGKEQESAVQRQIKQEIFEGKLAPTVDKVKERKRKLITTAAKRTKKTAPPDLLVVITQHTEFIKAWTKQLEEMAPYVDYIDRSETVAKNFREAVQKLIDVLKKFLKPS